MRDDDDGREVSYLRAMGKLGDVDEARLVLSRQPSMTPLEAAYQSGWSVQAPITRPVLAFHPSGALWVKR